MTETSEVMLQRLVAERERLEKRLQSEALRDRTERLRVEGDYGALQKGLLELFRRSSSRDERIRAMLELMKLLENKLVYLQNFTAEPSADLRRLSELVANFVDELVADGSAAMTPLEALYYRGVLALFAGQPVRARQYFQAACESEESDEANDIKFKSYVILGNLSHDEQQYETARTLHDESMRYSQHPNVLAQALAFKALNSYALGEYDEARRLFEEALALFDPQAPFFNAYFHRNALLFCGLIAYERRELDKAQRYYEEALKVVEPASYDAFEARVRLGKIHYRRGDYDGAVASLGEAVEAHRLSENEYAVDAMFWLARASIRSGDAARGKELLERISRSPVDYDRKPEAARMLEELG